MMQKQWATVDYRRNMSIIGLVQEGGHKEIMAIGTYAEVEEHIAEVAFVVREDFQGFGIASYLLDVLEKIAKENDYEKFTATVLRGNTPMIHVFKKRYPNLDTNFLGGSEMELTMNFEGEIAES